VKEDIDPVQLDKDSAAVNQKVSQEGEGLMDHVTSVVEEIAMEPVEGGGCDYSLLVHINDNSC